jgi:hypothetical protein
MPNLSYLGSQNPRRRAQLGKAEDAGSAASGSRGTTTAASTATPSSDVFPPIPRMVRPKHPYAGAGGSDDPMDGARWMQFITAPDFPSLETSWSDPGWTHPVEQFVRAKLIHVSNAMMGHVKTMVEVSANSIINNINGTIDTMFDKMSEFGNNLIDGVNRGFKLMYDTLSKLANDIKAQIDALTKSVKEELAKAQKAITDTMAQAKKDAQAQFDAMKADLTQARKDIAATLQTAQDAATKQFASMQKTLIDEQGKALDKARADSVAAIQKETAAARDAVTSAVKSALDALPQKVADVTASEFQKRGFVAMQTAPAQSGGGFKWPFSRDIGLGFLGLDIRWPEGGTLSEDDGPSRSAAEEMYANAGPDTLIDPEFAIPFEDSYAHATRDYSSQDRSLFAVGASKKSAGLTQDNFIGGTLDDDGTE